METGKGLTRRILVLFVLLELFCSSAAANLVSHWKFDESSGTTAYDSQGSNDGTIYGATRTAGQINGALNFDGTNDYVTVENNASQQITTNQITLAAWIKLTADVGNTQKRIICKQQNGAISWGLQIFGNGYGISTGNQVAFHDSDGISSWRNCISPAHLSTGQWYHVAVTDNAGQIRIYIDGQLDSFFEDGYGIPSNINSPINIGKTNPESAFFFNGSIDEVMIFNNALSAEEVNQIYQSGLSVVKEASSPVPSGFAVSVDPNIILSWKPGAEAVLHEIYLGTDFNDVNDADTSSPVYKTSQDSNSYTPDNLEYLTTYFWRIDENNSVELIKGDVWRFTTRGQTDVNCIAWWKLDEGGGPTAFDLAGGNNGTLTGGPVWTTGQVNGALRFDGANDYVNIPNSPNQQITTNQITLGAWIMLDEDVVGTQKRIICKQQSGSIAWGLEIFGAGYGVPSGNHVVFHDSSGSSSAHNCISPANLISNQWYHIAATDNAGEIRIYLNGQLNWSDNDGYGIPANINAPIAIGSTSPADNTFYFDGIIDEVMIYNRALSAEEILQLYVEGIGNKAYNAQPANGSEDVSPGVILNWTAGKDAVSHNVYFGTSFDDIDNATTASSEFKGNQPLDANSYNAGGLIRGNTYYWRIDELDSSEIVTKGFIWNFTVTAYIGWWKFDETEGNIAYDSAGCNNGALINGPVRTSGKIAGAIVFDGDDDYVEIPDFNFNAASQVSISAWVKTKSLSARQAIVGQWNFTGSTEKKTILLEAGGDTEQRFNFYLSIDGTDATTTIVSSRERFLPDSWYYVAATYDGSKMRIYIDGRLDGETEKTGNIFLSDTELNIGAFDYGGTGYFNGDIDDVRIYGRALSETEVVQFFEDGGGVIDCYHSIDPYHWQFNVPDMIYIETPDDAEAVRANIIGYLWPQTGWPGDKMPESVTTDYDPDNGSEWYVNLNNIGLVDRVSRLDIKMDRDSQGRDWHSYAYLLIPETSANRFLIFQMGHSDDILVAGGRETIDFFLERGFSVMTFWMPLLGENVPTKSQVPGEHNGMSEVLGDSFIHVFLEPVFVGINYVESQYNFRDITMVGISGGGWTTHMCAALDPRIRLSFPTAGSLPLFLRQGISPCYDHGSAGDAEQEWPDLYGKTLNGVKLDGHDSITGWLDVYILGGYGWGRGQIHILNQYDGCCFWGVNYRTYEPYVRDAIDRLGRGAYSVYLDSTHQEHKISYNVLTNVIYPRMQEHFTADFTENGSVDIYDLDIFADAWLGQTESAGWNENCDLFDDGQITLLDFAEFAKNWLWQGD